MHNNADSQKAGYPSSLKMMRFGEIQPQGWIQNQIAGDLEYGITGHYDKISDTVNNNLFVVKNRKSKENDENYFKVKTWWSGEHEGYWKDSVIRMAYLTESRKYMELAKQWIEDILANVDESGYIGIYCSEDRYNHEAENGELWTQSRIFMAMLAYYEATHDQRVLDAVVKAVKLTILQYRETGYFETYKDVAGGGVSHAIGFIDVLEYLYRITGDTEYINDALRFYEDFNTFPPRDDDLTINNLLDDNKKFMRHGPHISEGLLMPFLAFAATERKDFSAACKSALEKLRYSITLGGAMLCDEHVKGRQGTGYMYSEYCSMAEFNVSLIRSMQISGDTSMGDIVEKMTFNAAQGGRLHPVNRGVAYCSRDNQWEIDHEQLRGRKKYGATHNAACCTLNSGRLMPYYVEGMWMKCTAKPGIAAILYGPCEVNTEIEGIPIKIIEETNYPFDDQLVIRVQPDASKEFTVMFRIPGYSKRIVIKDLPGAKIKEYSGMLEITKVWEKGDVITAHFEFDIEYRQANDGEYYLQRGPLVFAVPVAYQLKEHQHFNHSGFCDYIVISLDDKVQYYQLYKGSEPQLLQIAEGDILNPWAKPPIAIEANFIDLQGNKLPVRLLPEGSTVLRRVTFSKI